MTRVRCYQVQMSVDGSTWNTVAHYFEKSAAELEAQASLFTYRRFNPKAKTRVYAHVETLDDLEYEGLLRQGVRVEKI